MEYLIARGLMEEIKNDTPYAFKTGRLEPVVTGFLAELNPNTENLWSWIESTKTGAAEDIKYLGGNAATLLCKLNRAAFAGKDLSGAVLLEADLRSADLRNTKFNGCVLTGYLSDSLFFENDLASAKFQDCLIYAYIFCDLSVFRDAVYAVNQIFDKTKKSIPRSDVYRAFISHGSEYILVVLRCIINNINDLKMLKSNFASQSGIETVSIYADELEKLFESLPEALKSELERTKMVSNIVGMLK